MQMEAMDVDGSHGDQALVAAPMTSNKRPQRKARVAATAKLAAPREDDAQEDDDATKPKTTKKKPKKQPAPGQEQTHTQTAASSTAAAAAEVTIAARSSALSELIESMMMGHPQVRHGLLHPLKHCVPRRAVTHVRVLCS